MNTQTLAAVSNPGGRGSRRPDPVEKTAGWHRLTVFGLPVWRSQRRLLCRRMPIVLSSLPAATGSHQNGNRCRPLFVFLFCSAVLSGIVAGQDNPASHEGATEFKVKPQPSVDPDKKLDVAPPVTPKLDNEKLKKLTIGLAAISGIAIIGIGGIAITMLWARRLRRLARELGPPQKTAGNDFWFLKPPKPTITESEIAESHRPPHSPPTSESQE